MMNPDHLPRIAGAFPTRFEFGVRGLTVVLSQCGEVGWVARLARPEPLRYHGLAAAVGESYGTTPQATLDTFSEKLFARLELPPATPCDPIAYVSHGDVVVLKEQIARLTAQLAECATVATCAVLPSEPRGVGSYYWSEAYAAIYEWRRAREEKPTGELRQGFDIRIDDVALVVRPHGHVLPGVPRFRATLSDVDERFAADGTTQRQAAELVLDLAVHEGVGTMAAIARRMREILNERGALL